MKKSEVVLLHCSSYEDGIYEKMKAGIELLGGLPSLIGKDENILVKPNLLSAASPDKAITTHPAVFGAVLRILKENGYSNVCYGDSPGSPVCGTEKAAAVSGLADEAEKYGVPLGNFSEAVSCKYPQGKKCREFMLCKAVAEADSIISVCKMKTHALENITGAIKNQYGTVFQANKALGHTKYPNSKSFAEMIVDLNLFLKPKLFVMDGIIAMEGNGPASGDPVPMSVILLSKDPVALDTVFARLVYLDPANVPTCVSGMNAGLGTMDEKQIVLLTPDGEISFEEAVRKFGNQKFDVKRKNPKFWRAEILLPFRKRKRDRPVVDLSKCIGCGICQKACPVDGKAVHSGNGKKAEYDYNKCIRCYCCQEMCPEKAISRAER
ncbi:MAG: DUF362 domain-containing protein [Eubacteriales bacterium]|nr:DUF362 domain-containing protein [Eubacteriales bacterium]